MTNKSVLRRSAAFLAIPIPRPFSPLLCGFLHVYPSVLHFARPGLGKHLKDKDDIQTILKVKTLLSRLFKITLMLRNPLLCMHVTHTHTRRHMYFCTHILEILIMHANTHPHVQTHTSERPASSPTPLGRFSISGQRRSQEPSPLSPHFPYLIYLRKTSGV